MKPTVKYLLLAVLLFSPCMLLAPRASAQGGVPLWTNRYDGPANLPDYARAIAVDSSGNVFVTGESRGNGTANDYATIKYSAAGDLLWINRYDGPASYVDWPMALAVDSNCDVVVTGASVGLDGGGGNSSMDFATIKYSSAGDPLWTSRYNGPGNNGDRARAIAVDSSGNVFVTGYSLNSGTGYDYATIAYSTDGVPLWSNHYNGPGNSDDIANAIAVDNSGNVFVTGDSYTNSATIAYSNSGVPLWTNRYNGNARALVADTSGNVFVTGSATIKYSSAGMPLWTNIYYNGYANAMALDSSGNVFVAGSTGTIKYSNTGVALWTNSHGNSVAIALDSSGNVFVTGFSSSGYYGTIAYSNAGVPLWTNRYDGGNNADYARAIAVDSSGNVFVTGYSLGSGTSYDYATIKYSSSVPPPRLDFQKLNNQLVLNWTNAGFSLQSAPALPGTFTNLPGATSPYTNPLTAPQQILPARGALSGAMKNRRKQRRQRLAKGFSSIDMRPARPLFGECVQRRE